MQIFFVYFTGFLSVLYVFRRAAGRDEEWKELILNKQSGNCLFPDCSMFGLFSVFYLSMSSASLAFTSSPRRFSRASTVRTSLSAWADWRITFSSAERPGSSVL